MGLYVMLFSAFLAVGFFVTGVDADDKSWADLNARVLKLYQQGKLAEAEPAAKQALDLAEERYTPDSPEVALSLNNLALIYKTQGKYDQATQLYERSLDIAEDIAGPDHPDLLVPLNNLAMVHEARGDKREADRIYERIRKSGHAKTADRMQARASQLRKP